MKAYVKRNAEWIVRLTVLCVGTFICVKGLGYDPDSLVVGAIVGALAIWMGELAA